MKNKSPSINLIIILFFFSFFLAGLQVMILGIVPSEVSCRFRSGKADCEIKSISFFLYKKNEFIKDVIKADVEKVRGSKNNTYKLRFVARGGGTADIERMSSNMGSAKRYLAEERLNSLIAAGKDFTFKYKSAGAVLFGAVFMLAGFVFMIFFAFKSKEINNTDEIINASLTSQADARAAEFISEREYRLLLFKEKAAKYINILAKITGVLVIVIICSFAYRIYFRISSDESSAKTNKPAAAAKKEPYYFYMYAPSALDEREKTAVNNWGQFYKMPHSPELVGYSGNNVYFKTIAMSDEEKDDFLEYMGNITYFNIGGPSYASISEAMKARPQDVEVDENSNKIRINMGDQSDFIISSAREAGDPEMKNSAITSTYYNIKKFEIQITEKGEVLVDIYFPNLKELSGFFNNSFEDPIAAYTHFKGITDTLPEDLK
jgi:hypothetical protein